MNLRTPLARVRGLGAAGEGVGHWWMQRLTAVALTPLALWFCFGVASLPGADYASVAGWVGAPVPAVLLMITVAVTFYHGYLGLQVVFEDYIAAHWLRTVAVVTSGFVALLLAVIGIFSILKLALGAPA